MLYHLFLRFATYLHLPLLLPPYIPSLSLFSLPSSFLSVSLSLSQPPSLCLSLSFTAPLSLSLSLCLSLSLSLPYFPLILSHTLFLSLFSYYNHKPYQTPLQISRLTRNDSNKLMIHTNYKCCNTHRLLKLLPLTF